MKIDVIVSCPINETPRVEQCRGLFDLVDDKVSKVAIKADIPIENRSWNIGLITGPSGSGKSTIAQRAFPRDSALWSDSLPPWPSDMAVVDGFPDSLGIKDVTSILSSVGFSSPPAWLRPYHVLSTGQKFRCDLARLLAQTTRGEAVAPLVFDEYTSVVDRTVAQIGSAAVAKTVRLRGLQFVAVTCHEDVEDWLQPDWVYKPDINTFVWRCLRRRPKIKLEIVRTTASAWRLFAPHHYLSADLNKSATCFVALWKNRPVAFSSWLPFVGSGPPSRREHRTVVLPDYQGVGVGMAVSDCISSMWSSLGYKARSTTTHPAFANARARSLNWRMVREPSLATGTTKKRAIERKMKRATTRLTSGWVYIGPKMDPTVARRLLGQ